MTNYSDQISSKLDFLLRKNKIINGNFDVWQRGTSFSGVEYTADRWLMVYSGSSAAVSQQSFTIGQTDVPGEPTYFIRNVVTSSESPPNYVYLVQRIEGVRTLAGETATLSFYAKADSSKNIAVEHVQNFGSGGSAEVDPAPTTCALTTSWQKFEITVDLPSISEKTISGGNDCLKVKFWFDAGSVRNLHTNSLGQQSGTFDIARVQLEKGSVATDFEDRPIGEELALCQRYFEIIEIPNVLYGIGVVRSGTSGTQMRGLVREFKVEKRVSPSCSETNSGQFAYLHTDTQVQTDGTAGNINVGANTTSWYIYESVSGTNSDAYIVWSINTAPVFEFDSEL